MHNIKRRWLINNAGTLPRKGDPALAISKIYFLLKERCPVSLNKFTTHLLLSSEYLCEVLLTNLFQERLLSEP